MILSQGPLAIALAPPLAPPASPAALPPAPPLARKHGKGGRGRGGYWRGRGGVQGRIINVTFRYLSCFIILNYFPHISTMDK